MLGLEYICRNEPQCGPEIRLVGNYTWAFDTYLKKTSFHQKHKGNGTLWLSSKLLAFLKDIYFENIPLLSL